MGAFLSRPLEAQRYAPRRIAAKSGTRAEIIGPLIEDVDATWPTGTTRTRDYLELAGAWEP
jgi:hypothetical protein